MNKHRSIYGELLKVASIVNCGDFHSYKVRQVQLHDMAFKSFHYQLKSISAVMRNVSTTNRYSRINISLAQQSLFALLSLA